MNSVNHTVLEPSGFKSQTLLVWVKCCSAWDSIYLCRGSCHGPRQELMYLHQLMQCSQALFRVMGIRDNLGEVTLELVARRARARPHRAAHLDRVLRETADTVCFLSIQTDPVQALLSTSRLPRIEDSEETLLSNREVSLSDLTLKEEKLSLCFTS